uniref:Uncharacterized protein n=1 Tax=Anguilla anguilla TaxID=7936 RepID=A0A0E9RQR4_ANGAN
MFFGMFFFFKILSQCSRTPLLPMPSCDFYISIECSIKIILITRLWSYSTS